MFKWQRFHFFDELERHGIHIEAFNPLLYHSWDEANESFLKKIKTFHFDLCLTDICNSNMLYVETLEEIKRSGIPTLCFRPDNLSIPFNDKVLGPHFDLVWLTSIDTKYLYDKWKINTIFAPYAANPYMFSYQKCDILRKISFVGTPYGSRSKMMNALISHKLNLRLYHGKNRIEKDMDDSINLDLKRRRLYSKLCIVRFKEGRKIVYGRLLNKLKGTEKLVSSDYLEVIPSVPFEKISQIYSSSVLALASTSYGDTDVLSEPLKVINLRNFEIPMSGGIEICKYNNELADYFIEDKEILFYKTEEELIDKAIYYTSKAKDQEILDIKKAARLKSENEHTWMCRFTPVFNKLGLKV